MIKRLLIHPEELSRKWIDRMADHGVDVLGLHPVGGEESHRHIEKMLSLLKTDEYRALLDYAVSRGLKIEYEMHAASFLVPRELFKKHPEYFRMDETGARTPRLNFCFSNPEAMEIALTNAEKLAENLYASEPNFYFWLDDDAKGSGCRCEKCRAYSFSDQQLIFENALVKRLKRVHPEACVSHLAYYQAMHPPKAVQPEEGIFLEYAPIERDMKRSLTSQGADDKHIHALLNFFGRKNARVLEYWFDNSYFSRWKKPPKPFKADSALIKEDISFYSALGFDNIASFACYLGEDYEALHGEVDISAFE